MSFRLAYLVTHPIQYQAPLLRAVARDPDIALKVFFGSDFSVQKFVDPGFGQVIEWDVPLLEGYEHEMLPCRFGPLAPGDLPSFWRPFNRGLTKALVAGRFQALWVHGYNRAYHWAAIAVAKRLGLKVLLRDEATDISASRGPVKQMLKSAFFRLLDQGIDAYLAIGRLNRDYYRGFGIDEAKIFPMPYAVDNAFFRARIADATPEREILRARLGLKPDRPVILFAGKLIPRKRPLDLLEAYARIAGEPAARSPYLLFAGDGELKPELERRIASHALDRVRLLGFQSQTELAALYDLADLFVLPSERESWGLVVNEAMNAGRAIILNDRIGAGADLLIDGENGFIYPVGDVEALATCLRTSLRDPERLAAMGRRSRAIVDGWSFREDIAGLKQALAAIAPGARA
jgi:glycosyltransferase involved in cell wall biosynthesis